MFHITLDGDNCCSATIINYSKNNLNQNWPFKNCRIAKGTQRGHLFVYACVTNLCERCLLQCALNSEKFRDVYIQFVRRIIESSPDSKNCNKDDATIIVIRFEVNVSNIFYIENETNNWTKCT